MEKSLFRQESNDVIPALLRAEFAKLDLMNLIVPKAQFFRELVDLIAEKSRQFRMTVVAFELRLFLAQRHQLVEKVLGRAEESDAMATTARPAESVSAVPFL